jgi:uncharacterized protein
MSYLNVSIFLMLLCTPALLQQGVQFTERVYQYELESKVPEELLKVTGEASSSLPHDRVALIFTASEVNMNPHTALEASSVASKKAIDSLIALGLNRTEYETQSFSIQKKLESIYRPWSQQYETVFHGYEVKNTIKVFTDKLDLAGKIINAVVGSGIKEVDSVVFSVADEKNEAERERLIALAIQDAKEKAELALGPLGYVINKVKLLNMDSFQPQPFYYAPHGLRASVAMDSPMGSAPAPLLGSKSDIEVKVKLEFLIGRASAV